VAEEVVLADLLVVDLAEAVTVVDGGGSGGGSSGGW
jgi:hypothetical protein